MSRRSTRGRKLSAKATTWAMLPEGTIKRIHVDRQVIARNQKHGTYDPPIKVQTSKGPIACDGAVIHGPSLVIYRPDKPIASGARLWIETRAAVEPY